MPRRSFSLLTMAAALGIAHPALGQPAPLPCNALCRAYMGSHYTPPGEPAGELSATSGVPEPEESSAAVPVMPQPPRRPVQAGLPAPRRFAVLPPPRPGTETRDVAAPTAGPGLPAPSPAVLDPTPVSAVRPDPIVPAPDATATIEPPVVEPVAIPVETAPADAAPVPADPVAAEPAVDTTAPSAPSVLAPVPEPEPEQRSLLE